MADTADAFTDLEIRIFQKQDQGYPVEITLGGQQEFPAVFCRPMCCRGVPPET
jgi:hypothetical protein